MAIGCWLLAVRCWRVEGRNLGHLVWWYSFREKKRLETNRGLGGSWSRLRGLFIVEFLKGLFEGLFDLVDFADEQGLGADETRELGGGVAEGAEVAEKLVEGLGVASTLDDVADDQAQHFDFVGETGIGEGFELFELGAAKEGRIVPVFEGVRVSGLSAAVPRGRGSGFGGR